jgi:hypothetical protein
MPVYEPRPSSSSSNSSTQGNSAAVTASAASALTISILKKRDESDKRAYVLKTMEKRGIDPSQFEALFASFSKYLEDEAKHKGFPSSFEYKLDQKDQQAREKGFPSYLAYAQDELDRQAREKGFSSFVHYCDELKKKSEK